MDSKTIGLLLIGGGLVYFLTQREKKYGNFYRLPNGDIVPESHLPSLGYVYFYGRWITQTDLIAAMNANGITPNISNGILTLPTQQNEPNYWDLVNTIISSGTSLAIEIMNNQQQQKEQLIDDIIFKYTVAVSISYDANFPYNRTQLESFTLNQLSQIEAGNYPLAGVSGLKESYYFRTLNNCDIL